MMIRAVGYIRVSTAKQEISPEMQVERIRQFAGYNGYDLPSDRIIVDIATSGRKRFESRELGKKALELLEDADVIIFAKLSRAFRNAADAMTLVPQLLAKGKDVAFLDLGCSVSTTTGKMIMGMLSVLAEWEADIIAERTKECLDHAAKQGKKLGGVPYGSRPAVKVVDGKRVDTGIHVPDVDEQRVIAQIRLMRSYPKPMSYRRIAAYLNAEVVPTRRQRVWQGETVRKIARRT